MVESIVPQITYLVVGAEAGADIEMAPSGAHYLDIETTLDEQRVIWSGIYAFEWTAEVRRDVIGLIRSGPLMLQRGTGFPQYPDAAGRMDHSPAGM